MDLEARQRLLMEVPLFDGLAAADLRPLAERVTVAEFAPGQAIVRQGEPGERVYVIVEGRVEVLARVERKGIAAESVVSWLVSGDALGELSLLDGEPRSATCVAMTRTLCLCLEREDFLDAMARHWQLNRRLFALLAHRLRKADERLAAHATDPLTGVNNRRALLDLYERETARARRAARQGGSLALASLGVVFADVDLFKSINDAYGHQVGDEVLCAVAQALVAAGRSTDLVARYGGDEFVMLLPDAGRVGVEHVARRVEAEVAVRAPAGIPVHVSVGAALVDPLSPEPLDAVLARADSAMYRQKRSRHAALAVGAVCAVGATA